MFDLWLIAAIVAKFALYVGVLTSAGTIFAAILLGVERYRKLAIGFAILGLISAVFGFALQGVALMGDASGLTDPEMLGLLWSTPVGTALVWRCTGLALLICGLLIGRLGLIVSAIGGAFAIYAFTVSGHVSGREATLIRAVLFAHLLGVSFWIGILTPLRRLAMNADTFGNAAELGHRFGLLASGIVPALAFAGAYLSWEMVGTFTGLVATGYGRVLLLKIAFVAGLLALGAANKMRIVPGLRKGDQNAAARLVKTIATEWGVVLIILLITAVLTASQTLPT